jgi:hypothetical protein
MLFHVKFYRLLCVIVLFIFIFEMAALATETNSKKGSDDEILKMIGAEPTKTQSIPNESFSSLSNYLVRKLLLKQRRRLGKPRLF